MQKSNVRLVQTTIAPREALADAIQRNNAAVADAARITTAIEHAIETVFAARKSLATAESALAAAKPGEADHLAAVALGESDGAASPVKLAIADVERAQNDLTIAKATRDALEAREKVAASEIEKAASALDDTIKATLRAEAGATVASLLSKAKQLQEELISARVQLRYLLHGDAIGEPTAAAVKSFLSQNVGVLPGTYGSIENVDFTKHPAVSAMAAAMVKLRVDASAPLPT